MGTSVLITFYRPTGFNFTLMSWFLGAFQSELVVKEVKTCQYAKVASLSISFYNLIYEVAYGLRSLIW